MTAGLVVAGLAVTRAGRPVLDGVDLTVSRGEVVGVTGANGAGKTTLLDALSGFVAARGRVVVGDRDVSGLVPAVRARAGLARTFQGLELFAELTVAEHLLVATGSRARGDDARPVAATLAAASLDGVAHHRPGSLTAPQRRSLALARCLAGPGPGPVALLLDEPTAGLGPGPRRDLALAIRAAARAGAAVVVVDHVTELLDAVADRRLELVDGRLRPPARAPGPAADVPRAAPPRDPPGPPVVRARGLRAVGAGGEALDGIDLDVAAGEVVAVVGPSGAGTSALLGVLAGEVALDEGRATVAGVELGPRPRARALARAGVRAVLAGVGPPGGLTAGEHLRLARGPARPRARPDLDALVPELAGLGRRGVASLSGGQRQLLAVAGAAGAGPRLLVLEEATSGLAPASVAAVGRLVAGAAAAGAGVVLADPPATGAVAAAHRVVVLARGRVVAEVDQSHGPRPAAVAAAYEGAAAEREA